MKVRKMTLKSTSCRNKYKNGILYRILFSNIPEYAKEKWLKEAKRSGIETESPMLEMEAVLMPNEDLYDIEIKYYFNDGYIDFDLDENDEKEMFDMFVAYCKRYGEDFPDSFMS